MIAWLLFREYKHENEDLLGVFSSKAMAWSAASAYGAVHGYREVEPQVYESGDGERLVVLREVARDTLDGWERLD